MAVREIIEILVTPNCFRNIDFSRKGVYSLKFKISFENSSNKQKIYGYPFIIDSTNSKSDIFKSTILSESFEYRSKGFYVSFNDESISFQSSCLFRLQLNRLKPQIILLEIDLLHIDIAHNDIENLQNLKQTDFKIKSTRTIKLNRFHNKEIQFHGELIFDTIDYFSVLELSVESRLLDYRYRIHQYHLSQFSKMNAQQRQTQSVKYQIYKAQLPTSIGKNLCEQFKDLSLQEYYEKMILNQVDNYESLREKYVQIINSLNTFQLIDLQNSTIITKENQPKDLSKLYKCIEGSEEEIQQILADMYQVQQKNQIYAPILMQSNLISKNIRSLWRKYAQVTNKTLKKRFTTLKSQQDILRFSAKIRRFIRDLDTNRSDAIQIFKNQQCLHNSTEFNVTGIRYPLFFSSKTPENHKKLQGQVLNVFVHGFQGSQLDLELMRNYILLFHKQTTNLLCHTLQNQTQDNIQILGEKFASQVTRFIEKSSCDFKRINFIGYSLGGIIIRAGLKFLEKFKDKMNILITLASPHLGISEMDNPLVSAGIWYMIKFDKVRSMAELNLKDNQNIMLKLSKEESLTWLKKLIVVSSKQDSFVPNYSAKIQARGKGEIVQQIYNNMILRIKQIIRVDVWFDAEAGTIDKILGRKSHIEFLQSQGFSQIFFSVFGTLF